MIKGINNCNVLVDGKFIKTSITIKKGLIESFSPCSNGINIEDNLFVVPGFIDKHFHGLSGVDVVTCNGGELVRLPFLLAKEGVTSYLLTITTSEKQAMIDCLQKIMSNESLLLGFKGVHLEGPFLSKDKAGAQEQDHFMKGTLANWCCFQPFERIIKQVTLAPEECDIDFLEYLNDRNIIVSAGHSALNFKDAKKYMEYIDSFTHTFNAMSGLDHRNPGLALHAMTSNKSCEIIADLIHVNGDMIKLLYNNNNNMCLITDAIEAKGLSDGIHFLGNQAITKTGNKALTSKGNLAGSVLQMNEGVNNLTKCLDVKLEEVINLASLNPAKCLKIDECVGSIAVGKEANFTVIDKDVNIYLTVVNGKVLYKV